jgi:hypothetical protein
MFRCELARGIATMGGSPIVRLTIEPRKWRTPEEGVVVELDPAELWELIGVLLHVASGGLYATSS